MSGLVSDAGGDKGTPLGRLLKLYDDVNTRKPHHSFEMARRLRVLQLFLETDRIHKNEQLRGRIMEIVNGRA